jgi:hypothetical protein
MNYSELAKPLYHGTHVSFSKIDLTKSAPKKDIGRGFYTTNDLVQANKFARLKAVRANLDRGYVLTFDFTGNDNLTVKVFPSSDEQWFDFVLRKRGFEKYTKPMNDEIFDIVIGPVANDAVGVVLNNFIDGIYGDQNTAEAKETAIRLLLTQKLHKQVFFGTERAIQCLTFREITDVHLD